MNKLGGFVTLLFVIGSGYLNDNIAALVVNYGISNTIVLEIP